MFKENHPNFHAIKFTSEIMRSYYKSLRGKSPKDNSMDISDLVHVFVEAVEGRVDWSVRDRDDYLSLSLNSRKDLSSKGAMKNIDCEHAFETDGGPCTHCGKTWIEIQDGE